MVTTRRNSDDDVPNFEAMITATVANALPNLTTALRTQITNDTRNGAGPSGGGGGDAIPQGIHVWIERFTKLKPFVFRPRLTVRLYLEGDALELVEARLHTQVGGDALSDTLWVDISAVIDEYSGGVPGAGLLDWLVLLEVRHGVLGVSQDQSVEHRGRQDRAYDSKRQDFRGQDQRFNGRNGNDRQGQGLASQRRSTETLPPLPLCTTCGKPHPGVCYKAIEGCFTCGSTQHKATTRDQAAKTSGTITGTLYIDDRTVFVLFDTGATNSIISTTFAKKLNVTPTPLIERVIISTPMRNHMLIDHEYVNCPLCFNDRIRPANLLPILMLDFDVILGMDWLASHRATIDCYARTVIFVKVCQPEFVLHGFLPLIMATTKFWLCTSGLYYAPCRVYGLMNRIFTKEFGMQKVSKWSLVTEKSPFLGHIVSAEGIIMDPSKVEAITKWPRPTTVTEVPSGKANVVADALSRKSGMIACFDSMILHDLERLDSLSNIRGSGGIGRMRIESNLMLQIKEAQRDDNRLCVPNDQALREKVMTEAHSYPFYILSSAMIFQKVKLKHQRASGLLQPLEIPMWKWDEISMDFVTGLPTTQKRHDAIWVVVDRLTKSAHFLPIRKDYGISKLAEIFQQKLGELVLSSSTGISSQTVMASVREDHLDFGRYAEGLLCYASIKAALSSFCMVELLRHLFALDEVGERLIEDFGSIGEDSYQMALSSAVIAVHDVYHVSLLGGDYHYLHCMIASYPFDLIQPDMSLSEEPEHSGSSR
ncbi:reverse transcriptase domain-containing protein [Tanacetum coccineum]